MINSPGLISSSATIPDPHFSVYRHNKCNKPTTTEKAIYPTKTIHKLPELTSSS